MMVLGKLLKGFVTLRAVLSHPVNIVASDNLFQSTVSVRAPRANRRCAVEFIIHCCAYRAHQTIARTCPVNFQMQFNVVLSFLTHFLAWLFI